MTVIITDTAVDMAILLVPEKQGMERKDKDVERRDKKENLSCVNRKLAGYEERNTAPTGPNNPHRQVCVTEMTAK